MNDGVVPDNGSFIPQDWPAEVSFVFSQAPLVVSTLTLSSKVRPEAYAFLDQAAREVNTVWNFLNAITYKAWHGRYGGTQKWLSAFDLSPLLAGCGEVFSKIGIDTAQAVAEEHATRRSQFKKSKLRFRKSGGSRKSLGWIPFKPNGLRFSVQNDKGKGFRLPNDPKPVVPAWPQKIEAPGLSEKENKKLNAKIRKEFAPTREAAQAELLAWENRRVQAASKIKMAFMGKTIRLFNGHRLVSAYRLAKQGVGALRSGNFSQDSCGDWYLNVVIDKVELALAPINGAESSIGLDPGQTSAMTGSDGRKLRSRRYRDLEPRIAQAQSTGHKKQAKRLNRKAKRQRQDDRNKFSRGVIDDYARVWIGDLSPVKLKKSKLKGQAKSISDSAIGAVAITLTAMGHRAGRVVEKVNEAYSSRRCSNCQALSGPSGLDSCDVRAWTCTGCGIRHNRDRNGGLNLSHAGQMDWNSISTDQRVYPEPRYWEAALSLPIARAACTGASAPATPSPCVGFR